MLFLHGQIIMALQIIIIIIIVVVVVVTTTTTTTTTIIILVVVVIIMIMVTVTIITIIIMVVVIIAIIHKRVTGRATVGTLCQGGGRSVSVIEDRGAFQSVHTAAHELGHRSGRAPSSLELSSIYVDNYSAAWLKL